MRQIDCPSATDVAAVVVTHNGADWIEACLHSLADSHQPLTTIAVDNGSTDNTAALVDAFPHVIWLPQDSNLGFGRANNIGIRAALERGAEWVFLLNQDARVEPETIGELVRVSQKYPRFGILSPFHLDGKATGLDVGFATHLYRAGSGLLSDLYLGRRQEVYPTAFVNAAAWLLRRDCIDKVGGFDPIFFMYGEDDDYCARARWHGFEIGLVPSATMCHSRPSEQFSQREQGRTLESIVAWRFAEMLCHLKRPDGSFVRRVGSWGVTSFKTGVTLTGTRQFRGLLAWITALLKASALLPKIRKHRKTSHEQGRHWI